MTKQLSNRSLPLKSDRDFYVPAGKVGGLIPLRANPRTDELEVYESDDYPRWRRQS